MKRFFLNQSNITFQLFDFQHCIYLICFIIGIIAIIVNKEKIKNINEKRFNTITKVFCFVLLINQLIYRGAYIVYNIYNFHVHLDLYFCVIVMYLFVISILFSTKNLYKLIYPLVFIGPLLTVIFPDLATGYDTYVFYNSIIGHGLLFLINLFVFVHYRFKMRIIDFFKSFLLANLVVFTTYIFNYLFHTLYNTPLDILKQFYYKYFFNISAVYSYLFLELLSLIGISLSFSFSLIIRKNKKAHQ